MHSPHARPFFVALTAAAVLALSGAAWEFARFGTDDAAARRRLEAEVRHAIAERSAELRAAAQEVVRDSLLVSNAAQDRNSLPALFNRLAAVGQPAGTSNLSVSVYVPAGGEHRVLAWSEGPAEDLLVAPAVANRVIEGLSLFVARGTLGLRLVFLQPIAHEGRHLGVVAAETVLSTSGGVHPSLGEYRLATSFGPVAVADSTTAAGTPVEIPDGFSITSDAGSPLLVARFTTLSVQVARSAFRRRYAAVAALPLIGFLLTLIVGLGDGRRRTNSILPFLWRSLAIAGIVVIAGLALVVLARLTSLPQEVTVALTGLTALGCAVVVPVAAWWRTPGRRSPDRTPGRLVSELALSGLAGAGLLLGAAIVLRAEMRSVSLDRLTSPLFPLDAPALTAHAGQLCLTLAAVWTTATMFAIMAERWRVSWRRPVLALIAVTCWSVPTLAVSVTPHPGQPLPYNALILAAGLVTVFALTAARIRRLYRRAPQSTRLLMLFAATVVPGLVFYAITSFTADRTAQDLIERDYAPATKGHLEQLHTDLAQATLDIDRLDGLVGLVAAPSADPGVVSTDAAFLVWSQTVLARSRLTSALELYGPDGALFSRFALNVPEYRAKDQTYEGTRCDWEIFGEVAKFGADERRLLHAERALCDREGTPRGTILVHVMLDYRALPFISSRQPYDDVLRSVGHAAREARLRGVQAVVYGWGRTPLFTSSHLAWPLDPGLMARIEQSREPFWTTLGAEAGTYRVHFSNDRAGIYALGYPAPNAIAHLTRLAETIAIAALVFVLLLGGTTIAAPAARRRTAPLRVLVTEIRTSFYRKLFLYFVLAAIGPVLVFALAFGAYMGAKLRTDAEAEATIAATIARRMLEESLALQQTTLTDDLMVWIGQVINEDVNVFEGPGLVATSQRDLFDSGLFPERTPAAAYRAIALDRLPSFVAENRLGPSRFLVAAAPVPSLGRDAVLSVPLALRQQEIEREVTDLNRGVLLGAVFVTLLAAGLGASVAQRVSDPVARLTRATRQIAAGRLEVRIVADTADELRRLVDDFNSMAATLREQRAELGRTHELKAWAEMSRQVAHEIKNPLTPIQLAAEHLDRVHRDQGRPIGAVFEQCVSTILGQVKLLRRIASEFSNFAATPVTRLVPIDVRPLVDEVIQPYRAGLAAHTRIEIAVPASLPAVRVDRTLLARALTNLVENALQAMPQGGALRIAAATEPGHVCVSVEDTGVGMAPDAIGRAFEPYFSTKTAGSGLGLANARRNIESFGGTIRIASAVDQGTTVTLTLPVADPPGGRGTA